MIQILYEDNHLIGVFKPANILAQGDATGDASLLEMTREWIREKYEKPGNVYLGLVHRLDRPVSGVMIFAKTSKAAARISEQFREKVPKKTYRAIVEGVPASREGTLVHYLSKGHRRTVVSESTVEGVQLAELSYRVLETARSRSLLEIYPRTGRKHQIRAQLAHIGHPVVGDRRYKARTQHSGPGIALVAKRLKIRHPVREDWITIEVSDELCPAI